MTDTVQLPTVELCAVWQTMTSLSEPRSMTTRSTTYSM